MDNIIHYNNNIITFNSGIIGYISPPMMAPGSTWYKGSTDRFLMTEIQIVDSYVPTGTVTEQWNADVNNSGSIKVYVEDTKLTIVGNGAGRIMTNEDSSMMFYNCPYLTSLNLSIFDTSNTINMNGMIKRCDRLRTLDLSSFDTSNVTNMEEMFANCRMLKTIYVSNKWSTESATSSTDMFYDCPELVGAVPFDLSKTDASMANYTTGYLTYKAHP